MINSIAKTTGYRLKSSQIEPLSESTASRIPFTKQSLLLLTDQRKSISDQLFKPILHTLIKLLSNFRKVLIQLISEVFN